MAKRAARKTVRKPAPRSARTAASAPQTDREKIITAFFVLLEDKPFAAIGFNDIAQRSGLSLAQVRGEFASTFSRRTCTTCPKNPRASGCSTF
jgi:hypothetical protein